MAYIQLPTRTTASANSATDINQLEANIEACKGGNAAIAPTTTIEDLSSNKLNISALSASTLILGANTKLSIGNEISPDCSIGGLCLNQGTADGYIITMKSSDVNHGITGFIETDSFASQNKYGATTGGIQNNGYSSDTVGVCITGFGTNANTTTGIGALAAIVLDTEKKAGTGATFYGADDNLVVISTNTYARHIFKGDGDIYTDTDQTAGLIGTYDSEDDIMLAETARFAMVGWEKGIIKKHYDRLQELGIMKGTFISHRKMQALNLGAIGQLFNMIKKIGIKFGINEQELLEIAKI